jgi:hypothetical protein
LRPSQANSCRSSDPEPTRRRSLACRKGRRRSAASFLRRGDCRHSCPHCQEVYRRTYFPGSVILGDGRRICSECGMAFDDQSRKWSELRCGQKLRLLLPPDVLGLSGGYPAMRRDYAFYSSSRPGELGYGSISSGCFAGSVYDSCICVDRDPLTSHPAVDRALQGCNLSNSER